LYAIMEVGILAILIQDIALMEIMYKYKIYDII